MQQAPQVGAATESDSGDHRLAPGLVALLACGAGLGVASIYYNQPMLGALAADFSASPTEIGRIPTLTQLGQCERSALAAGLSTPSIARDQLVPPLNFQQRSGLRPIQALP